VEAVVVVTHSFHLEGAISQTLPIGGISEAGGVEEVFHMAFLLTNRCASCAISPAMKLWTAKTASITLIIVILRLTDHHMYTMHPSKSSWIKFGIQIPRQLTT
jgi:hypothetical protein